MRDRIKKAIEVLEVNKMISSTQTEFVESADIAIKALSKQIELLDQCDSGCKGCPYGNHASNTTECANDLLIKLN